MAIAIRDGGQYTPVYTSAQVDKLRAMVVRPLIELTPIGNFKAIQICIYYIAHIFSKSPPLTIPLVGSLQLYAPGEV